MNRIFLLLVCFLICGISSAQADWELKKNKNNIVIHTRTPAGNNLKEYRATAEIQAPIKEVYSFLTDLESRPQWVIKCMGIEILDTLDGVIRYHTSYDIPWPLADRDLLVRAEFTFPDDSERAHLLTRNTEDIHYPVKEGLIRMPGYREEVFLEKIDSETTLFKAEGFADPGGKVPAWVVNMFLVDGIYDSVIRTRELVAGRQESAGQE